MRRLLIEDAFGIGLFPGCTIYLTLFYTKREIALRIGYLFVSAAIAGAFGGLLACKYLGGRHVTIVLENSHEYVHHLLTIL